MARRTTKKSKPKKRKKSTAQSKTRKQLSIKISPQRRIDIIAIVMVLIGLLTLVSLFTQSSGNVTGWWVDNLKLVIGWGVYLLPVVLIGLGVWLLLRKLDKLPRLSAERNVGIFLFFINLTAWFHLAGGSGGIIGTALTNFLVRALDTAGTVIALLAWLLISIILSLDLAMANIIKWGSVNINTAYISIMQALQKLHSRIRPPGKSDQKTPEKSTEPRPATRVLPEAKTVTGDHQDSVESNKDQGDSDSLYYNQMPHQPKWVLPDPNEILDRSIEAPDDGENDRQRARVIEDTLRSFGAPARVTNIQRGPTITLFGVEPGFVESRNGRTRVRVSKITALADDLALALAASRIRIQAPVPGKGYIGIEVPNRQIALVSLYEVMVSTAYQNLKSPLKIALGKDVAGNVVAADLTAMPHLLIAGTTGAGKSVCINDILACFLLNMTPDELRLILVDPKRVELTGYNGIPHLLAPVIVDAEHVVGALQWMMREMDIRYRKFSDTGTRNIADYNALCDQTAGKKLPYLLVVIDELADLMMLAPDETERAITRLAQLARATGIHLILATQRPSTDILTGLIKANFPARIAFAVASSVDSRVILDQPGAERLLGRGDMLFQAPDAPAPVRIQSAFISDAEINRLAAYWRGLSVTAGSPERPDQPAAFQTNQRIPLKQTPLWEEMEEEKDRDPKYDEAIDVVLEEGQASISMLQRKMRIGYTRAARMIDMMEEKGIISEPDPKTQIRTILENNEDGSS